MHLMLSVYDITSFNNKKKSGRFVPALAFPCSLRLGYFKITLFRI